jgi:hypothetical protein
MSTPGNTVLKFRNPRASNATQEPRRSPRFQLTLEKIMARWARVEELDRQTDRMAMEIFACTLEEWRALCAATVVVDIAGELIEPIIAMRHQEAQQDDMSVEMTQSPSRRSSLVDIDYTESMAVEVPLALPEDMQDLHGLHDVSSVLFCHTPRSLYQQQAESIGLSSQLVNDWFDTM